MDRRTFIQAMAAAPALSVLRPVRALAELPKAKITRVRIYKPPELNPLFNQSNMVVTVETDIGITGIGEGGAKDTLEQCAGTLIGKNPFRIEAIWQEAYIAWFYPPGREKTHALGALDLALWDIKGKALCAAGARAAGRRDARLLRVLRDGRRAAAGHAGRREAEPQGAGAGDHGGRLSRVPDGRRRRADRRRLRHALGGPPHRAGLQGGARGRRARRQLVHRLPPALRPERRAALLPARSRSTSRSSSRTRSATSTRSRTSRSSGR